VFYLCYNSSPCRHFFKCLCAYDVHFCYCWVGSLLRYNGRPVCYIILWHCQICAFLHNNKAWGEMRVSEPAACDFLAPAFSIVFFMNNRWCNLNAEVTAKDLREGNKLVHCFSSSWKRARGLKQRHGSKLAFQKKCFRRAWNQPCAPAWVVMYCYTWFCTNCASHSQNYSRLIYTWSICRKKLRLFS